ncbi:hypothetical protein OSB04_012310 [Centaurea solstitialis]|uniref:Uncharacterized protein n=1 Tax=Centaurea solstitialis TaxID=347529 RepID=A0AA38TLT2_9ASTR|nr:hypothetical protein OSB04_012310 [Centaurea solstitialis]
MGKLSALSALSTTPFARPSSKPLSRPSSGLRLFLLLFTPLTCFRPLPFSTKHLLSPFPTGLLSLSKESVRFYGFKSRISGILAISGNTWRKSGKSEDFAHNRMVDEMTRAVRSLAGEFIKEKNTTRLKSDSTPKSLRSSWV